jgi:hypothetical protein
MRAGVVLCAASLLALAALQHAMPEAPISSWGVNPVGATHLQQAWLGRALPRLSEEAFVVGFRMLLAGAWAGYGIILVAGLRGGTLNPRPVFILVAALALVLALFGPPTLSSDAYAYAGFARLQLRHGLNPYLHTPTTLSAHGDPSGALIGWDIPYVYGPAWLIASIGLLAALPSHDLALQVIVFKLVEAAALVGAALAGRAVARCHDPRRADLTLAAIGLNPLFLIEGPLSGHNDLLMATLILTGVLLFQKGKDFGGALLVGLATGVKLVPVVLVPWLMLAAGRRRPGLEGLGSASLVAALALAPTVVGYVPFWEGAATFNAQRDRLNLGPAASGPLLERAIGPLVQLLPMMGVYLALSFGLTRRGWEASWPTAWAVLSLALILLLLRPAYPWYLLWPLSVSLTRWDRWHVILSAACLGLALLGTMGYTAIWM